jgi:hypothetical protein
MKKALAMAMMVLMTAGLAAAAEDTSWLEIGGDYQFRYDMLSGKVHDYMQYTFNSATGQPAATVAGPGGIFTRIYSMGVNGHDVSNDSLMTNKFDLHLKAKATEDVTVKAKLNMYKIWGNQTADSTFYSPDKSGVFDGNSGHVPEDNTVRVDYAYATWSNIAGVPAWFSVGRRPSTGGSPSNLRANTEKIGTAGVPSFLIDYAFDGMTFGYAPDINALPGAYAKFCYGRGYESGYHSSKNDPNTLKDVDMIGVNIVPLDTTKIHVEVQYDRAYHMMSNPPVAAFGAVQANIGDIEQAGILVTGKAEKLGPGDLNWFASAGMSKTHPNDNGYTVPFGDDGTASTGHYGYATYGLLYDDPDFGGKKESHTGSAIYIGARYDLPSRTKIGLEYNQGSKYWIAFAPAADDMIASKVGTRGQVYEAYIIQELNQTAISKYGKAFFKLTYQYYDFEYTGSNGWLGAPKKISELNTSNPMNTQMYPVLDTASDIYLTFNVTF